MSRALSLAVLLVISSSVMGFPKPAPVPLAWELDFQFENIKRIKVDLPGDGIKTYWYLIYTAQNETGRDVVFHPEITLVTDSFKALPSGVNVPPEVFKAIKGRHRNVYPWLEHPRELVGKLRQGEDNARDSVAIWPDFNPLTVGFDVLVSGLSGEAVEVANPLFTKGADPKKVKPKFVLRKTFRMKFRLPTDPSRREKVEAELGGRPAFDWIMR